MNNKYKDISLVMAATAPTPNSTTINNEVLGEGTYGKVSAVSKDRVVKTISFDHFPSAVREFSLLEYLKHPNIVELVNIEIDTPKEFRFYMKRYPFDLYKFLKEKYPLPVQTVIAIAAALIRAINYTHHMGVIHCDLKPENVLVDDTNGLDIRVCDFGIAIHAKEDFHTSCVQTVTYRAPEIDVIKNKIKYGPKVDIWSLGCLLIELVTGNSLFNSTHSSDSSINACLLFGLPPYNNRQMRMRVLRDLQLSFVRDRIGQILYTGKAMQYHPLLVAGYTHLIACCMHPDPNKRYDSKRALNDINLIMQNFQLTPPEQIVGIPWEVSNKDHDEIEVIVNVPARLLLSFSKPCLNFANRLFERVSARTEKTKYICVYLAACMFSIKVSKLESEMKCAFNMDIKSIYSECSKIMLELKKQLLK